MPGGTKRARANAAVSSATSHPPVEDASPQGQQPDSSPQAPAIISESSPAPPSDVDTEAPPDLPADGNSSPPRKSPMAVYQEILDSGYYDKIVEALDRLGTRALVNNVYGAENGTFVRRKGWKTGYTYESTKPGERNRDLRVAVVGEVCSMEEGTRLSAIGCHWPGNMNQGNNYIRNNTTVKGGLMLRNITLARKHLPLGDRISDTFIPLYQAKKADDIDDLEKGKSYDVKHCVVGGEKKNEQKLLSLHTKRMYLPAKNKAVTNAYSMMKAKDIREAMAKSKEARKTDATAFPPPPYTAGQLYDPAVLPDFNGNALFQNFHQRLVQLDFRYSDGTLIPPWEMYEALRPGTLVMATVTPTVFIMGESKDEPVDVEYSGTGNGEKKKRTPMKVYQLIIESLKILAESGEDVEERTPHPGFNSDDVEDPVDSPVDDVDPMEEFVSFKRRKLNNSERDLEGYAVSSGGGRPQLAHQGSSNINGADEDMDTA